MNCVGIDVSKGKSTIAVMRPFGEVVVSPFSFVLTELYHLKTALTVCGAKWVLFGAERDFW